ncbi:MAG: hypothetical protein K0S74_223 [Chlamydiales bacterium]|jgi:uncharacterized UPF0160 family protein|nr:hypothetical protein [Chlamydiales bacterium]
MNSQKIPRSFGTHSGTFHADEVTACSLLLLFNLIDHDKIVRSRDPIKLAPSEYLCDVGGIYDPEQLLFDHHQAGYQGKLSSAGMILLYLYKQNKITQEEYDFLNQSLVKGVDEHDIGIAPQLPGYAYFSHIVANFAPINYDSTEEEQNEAFSQALQFVYGHLSRLWKRYQYTKGCRELVAKCMEESSEVLMFDRELPWLENFFALGGEHHPAKFVIMPAGKHWKLRGIPPSLSDRMNVRIPLPETWGGLLQEQLSQASGIKGAIFCHKGRFISVWETKEDVLKALDYTLNYARRRE